MKGFLYFSKNQLLECLGLFFLINITHCNNALQTIDRKGLLDMAHLKDALP